MKLSEFKIGDKVEWISDDKSEHITGEVGCIHLDKLFLKNLNGDKGYFPLHCDEHGTKWICRIRDDGEVGGNGKTDILKLVKPYSLTSKIMDTCKIFRELLRQEPEKTFVKLGLLDESGAVTDDGIKFFITLAYNEANLESALYKKAKEILDKESSKDSK
jgi:hypothetical protein